MTEIFNPSFPNADSAPIQWNWITLTGPDSLDFLHRLTTVHVKALKTGYGAPGCFLTPQGKLRVYFTLWRYGNQEFAFELDAGKAGRWKTELLGAIDQYTFGEKISLGALGTRPSCRWIFPESSEFPVSPAQTEEIDGQETKIRLCNHGTLDFGRPWLTAWGESDQITAWLDRTWPLSQTVEFSTLEKWRIRNVRPRVDAEITEGILPLEIGLGSAIADQKGCYPGQEVIEKILALGSPPRRLVRIDGNGIPPLPGNTILNRANPPIVVGTITSVAPEGEQYQALGLLKKIHAKEGLEIQFEGRPGNFAKISSVAP